MRDLNALDLGELWRELVDPVALRALLAQARAEDLGAAGDVTSALAVESGRCGRAELRVRRPGVIAGLRGAAAVIEAFAARCAFTALLEDGGQAAAGEAVATLEGELRDILALERTLLNFLSRLSGVATATRRWADELRGTQAVVCDTRKTTPGWRGLEKYAVRCGGGTLHRVGLFDAVLLKDNHLAGLPPTALARRAAEVAQAARAAGAVRFVEVEVDSLEQLDALLELPAGTIDIVLLDNMDCATLAAAVARRGAARTPLLEASGGIRFENARAVAATGVDRIAVGAITHSAGILDLGLDVTADEGSQT